MGENKPIQEIPFVFRTTKGGHLDQNQVISSISAIDDELPSEIRTIGYPIWVEDVKLWYNFEDGILNSNFIHTEAVHPDHKPRFLFTTSNLIVGDNVITHSLNTENIIVQCTYNESLMMIDWHMGDTSYENESTKITIKSLVELNNVKISISAKI